MKQLKDKTEHAEVWMDTPIGVRDDRQKEARHPNDLLDAPGVHLKSRKTRGPHDSMPKFFGRLTSYTDEEVVVVSKYGSDDHPCVWTGTSAEYRSMWMVD